MMIFRYLVSCSSEYMLFMNKNVHGISIDVSQFLCPDNLYYF